MACFEQHLTKVTSDTFNEFSSRMGLRSAKYPDIWTKDGGPREARPGYRQRAAFDGQVEHQGLKGMKVLSHNDVSIQVGIEDKSKREIGELSLSVDSFAPEGVAGVQDLGFVPTLASDPTSPKLRLYHNVSLPPECVQEWNTVLMPRINLALSDIYRQDPRSVEVSLESIGPNSSQTVPTILVICGPVKRVRAELKKKVDFMRAPFTRYALKVCRGSMVRSHGGAALGQAETWHHDEAFKVVPAANGGFQERPMLGASIGAWVGDRHLPPVSFGGLIKVDNKTYGMTVHHMLDDPDLELAPGDLQAVHQARSGFARRSVATAHDLAYFRRLANEAESDGDEQFSCEFSSSDSEGDDEAELEAPPFPALKNNGLWSPGDIPGDIPGVEPGCGEGYIVTQPALDDVEEGFYASKDTWDEEHLDTFSFGEMYASSGIRRRIDERGLIHEVDWALFEMLEDRCPDENSIELSRNSEQPPSSSPEKVSPKSVILTAALPDLEVVCIGRTSGIWSGKILQALTSVKIYGRNSPSHSYQVASSALLDQLSGRNSTVSKSVGLPMGLPGDSGAWVISKHGQEVCGYILAMSPRKLVSYICPMEVALLDIVETLEAREVRLPGGAPLAHFTHPVDIDDLGDLFEDRHVDKGGLET